MLTTALLAALLLNLSALQQGEELFLANKPQEARGFLEKALLEEPQDERIYLYLGIVYEQLNDPQKSIQVMKRGLNVAKEHKDLLYYNIGNNLFRQEEYTLASEMYTRALEANPRLADAYLNRANAQMKRDELQPAAQDYRDYLTLDPDSPQRPQIERLLALLGKTLAEQERQRTEEAARQKQLLNEVLDSLKNASEDTRNLSAGRESIHEDYEDIDIQD